MAPKLRSSIGSMTAGYRFCRRTSIRVQSGRARSYAATKAINLTGFFPDGWAQVFAQPRYWPTTNQKGAFLFGEPGIEFPFIPPVVIPWFEIAIPLLKQPARTMAALKHRSEFTYSLPGLTSWGFDQTQTLTARSWVYHAAALMPWGDPGIYLPLVPPFIPPVITPTRTPGPIFTLDTVQGYVLGTLPVVNQIATMIFYVGPGLTTGPVLLTFTRPDGSILVGNPNFAFIGPPTIQQRLINNEAGGQYIVYTFAPNELNQDGIWHVSAIASGYSSQTWPFQVLPFKPGPGYPPGWPGFRIKLQ